MSKEMIKTNESRTPQFPYKHPIYNPDGPTFEGSLYDKIILEQEYKNLLLDEDDQSKLPEEVDSDLEKEVSTKIYGEFGKYISQKNCNTPILRELIENYIGTKLVQVRMNKVLYKDGVMKLNIRADEDGNLSEWHSKHPLLRDFNDLNNSSMTILNNINTIISGIKIEVTNKTASVSDLMAAFDSAIDADYVENEDDDL